VRQLEKAGKSWKQLKTAVDSRIQLKMSTAEDFLSFYRRSGKAAWSDFCEEFDS